MLSAQLKHTIHKKRGLVLRDYIVTSYMVVTNSYNYYSMQAITMHDNTITSQLELAVTYYNENIFTRVIKYREGASSRD